MMKNTLLHSGRNLSIFQLVALAAVLGVATTATPAAAEGPVDRVSDDLVLHMGEAGRVSIATLDTAVSGNSVHLSSAPGSAPLGGLSISGDSNLQSLYGVNAIAMNVGHGAVQNVTVVIGGSIEQSTVPVSNAAGFGGLPSLASVAN